MGYYILSAAKTPWGDYGDILGQGMSSHLARHNGLLQLERTGPFVPPITFPGISDVVVTDDFKTNLENSELIGISFRPVIKARIVRLDWQDWSRTQEQPPEYPTSGEPEDYILGNAHDADLAERIGALWEICVHFLANPAQVDSDWFRLTPDGYNYVSEVAKTLLERRVPEWVQFLPIDLNET